MLIGRQARSPLGLLCFEDGFEGVGFVLLGDEHLGLRSVAVHDGGLLADEVQAVLAEAEC